MTSKEARAHVQRECKRRKRAWGSENAARLKAMRLEIAILKLNPTRWANHMVDALHGKQTIGDGCYTQGRRNK